MGDLKGYKGDFLLFPRWPLWRGSTVFKYTLEVSNYRVHLHETLLNLQLLFSFFRRKRRTKIVMNRVGADLQVFMSGSNNRGTADIKDIMATGKRSQVARLVCEPSLVILSLVTYRILEKYLVLEVFADTG